MKRFRNLLVVVSPHQSDLRVVERAASLTLMNEGRLAVVLLAPEVKYQSFWSRVLDPDFSVEEVLVDDILQRLRPLLRPLQLAGREVEVGVISDSFVGVVRDVIRHQRDLVMLGAETFTDVNGHADSLVPHLIRKCPCAVWALRPGHAEGLGRIVTSVDVTHQSDQDRALNRQLLEMSVSLAALEDGDVTLAHAWELPGESLLHSALAKVSEEEIRKFARELEQERRALLDEFVASVDPGEVSVDAVLRRGDPANVVTNLVLDQGADLLVMGSVHRIRIRGFFIGNTAERILQRVPCSVLTVKPQGFRSPVVLDDDQEPVHWQSVFGGE